VTTQKNALHAGQHVRYVGQKGVMMSEPRDDDDVALGIEDEEILDDEFDTLEEKYGLA
jgi:hypothetical protein